MQGRPIDAVHADERIRRRWRQIVDRIRALGFRIVEHAGIVRRRGDEIRGVRILACDRVAGRRGVVDVLGEPLCRQNGDRRAGKDRREGGERRQGGRAFTDGRDSDRRKGERRGD